MRSRTIHAILINRMLTVLSFSDINSIGLANEAYRSIICGTSTVIPSRFCLNFSTLGLSHFRTALQPHAHGGLPRIGRVSLSSAFSVRCAPRNPAYARTFAQSGWAGILAAH